MGDPAREIESKALQLPPKERARLAQRLIASLDQESRPRRRAGLARGGRAQTRPARIRQGRRHPRGRGSRQGSFDASVRSVEFHPEAEAELISATQDFENHVENQGLDFSPSSRRYEWILEFPSAVGPSTATSTVPLSEDSLRSPLPRRAVADLLARRPAASTSRLLDITPLRRLRLAGKARREPGDVSACADDQRPNRVLFRALLPFPPFRLARSSPSPSLPGIATLDVRLLLGFIVRDEYDPHAPVA